MGSRALGYSLIEKAFEALEDNRVRYRTAAVETLSREATALPRSAKILSDQGSSIEKRRTVARVLAEWEQMLSRQ